MQFKLRKVYDSWPAVWLFLPFIMTLAVPPKSMAVANDACLGFYTTFRGVDGFVPKSIIFNSYPEIRIIRTDDLHIDQLNPSPRGTITNAIANLIEYAGDGMNQERGWGNEFNKYRMKAAIKYSHQSWYAEIYQPDIENFNNQPTIKGSIGITLGRAKGPTNQPEQIPMHDIVDEENGRSWKEALDKVRNSAGQIYEARTYRLSGESIDEKLSGRSKAMGWLFNKIKESTEHNPKMRELPIVFTYGDLTSIRMYRKMGFEPLTEKDGFPPLKKCGKSWYAMSVSPNNIVKENKKFSDFRDIEPNTNSTIFTQSGGAIEVTGAITYYKEKIVSYNLAQRTGFLPGILIPAGGNVIIGKDGSITLNSVEGISPNENAKVNGFEIKKKQYVQFNSRGEVEIIDSIAATKTLPGYQISIPEDSVVSFDKSGIISSFMVRKSFEIYPGVNVSENARILVAYDSNGVTLTIVEFSKRPLYKLIPGSFELKFERASRIQIHRNGKSTPLEKHIELSEQEMNRMGIKE